jgi:hypothetical protein
VALLGTVPVLVASGLESVLPDPEGRAGIATALVVRSIAEGVLEALVGLLLVELCYLLIAAELALRRRGRLGGALLWRGVSPPPPLAPGRADGAARC